jgi:hypothetical protein
VLAHLLLSEKICSFSDKSKWFFRCVKTNRFHNFMYSPLILRRITPLFTAKAADQVVWAAAMPVKRGSTVMTKVSPYLHPELPPSVKFFAAYAE